MLPEICFLKDLDSFTIEPNYLDFKFGAKIFRFVYPTQREDRKFFVKSLGQNQLALPNMLLQAPPFNVANPAYPMDFCAEFHDMVLYADFIYKLATIAGFEQMTIPPADAMSDSSFEDGDFSSEEFNDQKSDHIILNHESMLQFHLDPTRPKIKFVEGLPMVYNFNNGFFEVLHPEVGNNFRFQYPAVGERFLTVNAQRRNRSGRVLIVVANLTLQVAAPNGGGGPVRRGRGRPPARPPAQYVDVSEVDVEFDLNATNAVLEFNLVQQHQFERV